MMREEMWTLILVLLSCWEIWLCYQLLLDTVLEKEYLTKRDYAVIYVSVAVLGGLVGINRGLLFFSYPILYTVIGVIAVCTWGIERNRFIQKIGLTGALLVFIAVMDYFLAFLSASMLGEGFGKEVYYSTSLLQICIFSLTRIVAVLVVKGIKSWIRKSGSDIREFQWILLVWTVFGSGLLRIYQYDLLFLAKESSEMKAIGWAGSLLAVVFLFGLVCATWIKSRMLRQENEYLRQKEKMLYAYYQQIIDKQESNRRLIHDMKNHLLILKEYQENGRLDSIGKYLEEISEELWTGKMEIWTGNQVVDIVLNQKKNAAEQKGIRMEIQAEAAEHWILSDRESCSVFGNLLDNAIEACEKAEVGRRWIKVIIQCREAMIFIEISNSMGVTPKIEKGSFITSKKDHERHGLGLESVKRIVERHDGNFDCRVEAEKFCVNIALYE